MLKYCCYGGQGDEKYEWQVIQATIFEREYQDEGDRFESGGPEHALIKELKGLHSGRSCIASKNDSIKAVVTLHPNHATNVSTCTKGADTTWLQCLVLVCQVVLAPLVQVETLVAWLGWGVTTDLILSFLDAMQDLPE